MRRVDRRQKWMADFEFIVTKARPELAGKIDWNTATFLFNSGLGPIEAASRYVARVVETEESK